MKKIIITTGKDVRHRYLLNRAFQKFGNHIAGVIIQLPGSGVRSKKAPAIPKFSNVMCAQWTRINHWYQSKRLALGERLAFGHDKQALSRAMTSCPVLRTSDINAQETLEWLEQNPADILMVFGGRILKLPVIDKFPDGIVNIHMGLSPDYKGAHCIEWPLYHGRPENVGATVHFIDPGIDSGDVIAQFKTRPRPNESPVSITMRTMKGGLNLLLDTCEALARGGTVRARPQEKTGFCYYERHFTPEIRYGVWKRARAVSEFSRRAHNKIKRNALNGLRIAGLYRKFLPRLPYPAILLYHDVGPGDSPYLKHCDLSISADKFRDHVRVLGDFYNVASIEEIFQASQQGKRLPDTIGFSFDDGYKGILKAFKILEEQGFAATAYINGGCASLKECFWRNKMSYLVEKGYTGKLVQAFKEEMGADAGDISLNVFRWTKSRLQDPRPERAISRVFSDYGDEAWHGIYAVWDELKHVNRDLFKIGNHTCTHLCLNSLSSEDQEAAIMRGRDMIREQLSQEGHGVSIPFGEKIHYNRETLKIIEHKLDDYYLTANGGLNVVGLGREVKRIGIPNVHACQLPRILWNNI